MADKRCFSVPELSRLVGTARERARVREVDEPDAVAD